MPFFSSPSSVIINLSIFSSSPFDSYTIKAENNITQVTAGLFNYLYTIRGLAAALVLKVNATYVRTVVLSKTALYDDGAFLLI